MASGAGATLREARTGRGIALEEVEAATKIRVAFLEAIENEEWDRLPGEHYSRAFVRGYARYLGLDDALLAAECRRSLGPEEPAAGSTPAADPDSLLLIRPPRRRRRLGPRAAAAIASLALLAVLAALGLGSLGGGSNRSAPESARRGVPAAPPHAAQPPAQEPGTTLTLTAKAEVWVCLLDGRDRALIDGQILSPGSEEGPYRSSGFTVSFGNGQVTMAVDGRVAPAPRTPNPIGFSIDSAGAVRRLPEDERPTCT